MRSRTALLGRSARSTLCVMDDCCSHKGAELDALARSRDQRRVLMAVLALNAAMFVAEFGAGVVAGSAALMADAVDMLG